MNPETRAYISVASDVDDMPRLFRTFQVPFDDSRQIGEPGRIVPFPSRWSWCEISSGLPDGRSLEDHCVALAARIEPFRGLLKDWSARYSVTLSVVTYNNANRLDVHLSASMMKTLASIGAALDVDIYCLYEDGSPPLQKTVIRTAMCPSKTPHSAPGTNDIGSDSNRGS